ncbi:MAG: hypothetical protein ONB46_00885 [candidate division KSB1 bacterium]|nr:hypothetical protein [candidate division KSB1 bacterium]MDZ7364603.1 hypothetical protein [candidate division KSB1 bacterium]MDZ7402649.1 hypothetical protein [candidate division KSB1 bacterium]
MENDSQALATAAQVIGLDAKWLQAFDVEDPFNGNLRLRGFLCQKPDHRYGALVLTHVGEAEAPQLILATPKLHYPFGKDGSFHFPPVKKIHLYEKLDGTNVLAYRYRDGQGQWYLTYKLRLAPTLRNSRWGPFLDMWQELLKKHPAISKLVDANDCHISFEMYGSRNTHLMVYDVDLAVAALFGVRRDASIVPLYKLNLLGVPGAPVVGELVAGEDPVAKYAEIRAEMEKRNRRTEDEKLSGIEGTVWYVEEPDGRVSMWKCKPESVEEIHWAAGINKKAVIATCWNLLETSDELNYDTLRPLLLEEYQDREIEMFRPHIENCIKQVKYEFEFKERVLTEYDKLDLSIHDDKAGVMRALAPHFQRSEMKKVYTMIVRNR